MENSTSYIVRHSVRNCLTPFCPFISIYDPVIFADAGVFCTGCVHDGLEGVVLDCEFNLGSRFLVPQLPVIKHGIPISWAWVSAYDDLPEAIDAQCASNAVFPSPPVRTVSLKCSYFVLLIPVSWSTSD